MPRILTSPLLLVFSAGALVVAAQPTPVIAQIASSVQRAAARAAARNAGQKAAQKASGQAAQRQAAKASVDRITGTWRTAMCQPSRPCPLPEKFGASFVGGRYQGIRLGQDTRLHRAYSNSANRLGAPGERYSYWSREPATGRKAIIERAIPIRSNGNVASQSVAIRVSRGTLVFEGEARGLKGGPPGGGNQVVIDRVRRDWVE